MALKRKVLDRMEGLSPPKHPYSFCAYRGQCLALFSGRKLRCIIKLNGQLALGLGGLAVDKSANQPLSGSGGLGFSTNKFYIWLGGRQLGASRRLAQTLQAILLS